MTRPEESAKRFVTRLPPELRARLNVVYSPLIGIEPLAHEVDFDHARGLIFTSSNGVSVAARLTAHRDLPCFCVGVATTHAAREAGWTAQNVGNNAEDLIATLHKSRPDGPLLHLRGRHARGNVAARLGVLGLPTREQVIYDQPLLPFSQAAVQILNGPDPIIAPLFSPRTARQFANTVTGNAPLYLAALSEAVAEPVRSLNYISLMVTPTPDATAMAGVMAQLVDDAGWVEGAGSAQ
ncbi:MAG: uroporphyrinogen-III synthase [Rhodobacteraceae bacterium]|nr:MAG: uroporphyrinogen-III synthase [Paracoccaceae bacterium]